MRVVEALDEPEHLHARLGPGAETVASEELALQRGEKAWSYPVSVDSLGLSSPALRWATAGGRKVFSRSDR